MNRKLIRLSARERHIFIARFSFLAIRAGPLPFKRRRASSVRHHAVLRRGAEQLRGPVQKTHHRSGERSFFDLDQSSCSLFEGLMLTPTLNFDAPADHFTVGGAAGPEHSVHLRLHPHPPVSSQSVSTRGNNSKPGHRALADVRDDHLRVHLSTLSNVKEEGFDYKIRDIPTLLQNKSTQG